MSKYPPNSLIDTHCHLADHRFAGRTAQIIKAGKWQGVGRFIVPGTEPADWNTIRVLAEEHPEILPAYGLHPMRVERFSDAIMDQLSLLSQAAVAIGEIGLDYTLTNPPRSIQIEAFRAQLRLAKQLDLPVLIHCRKAFQDMISILDEEKTGLRGVMHAFSGSVEIAELLLNMGLYLSVAGTVTFSNAVKPVKIAERIPLERLLLETDSPDLAPEPFRGTTNEPAHLLEVAQKVAAIRCMSFQDVAKATTSNAARLFGFQNNIDQ